MHRLPPTLLSCWNNCYYYYCYYYWRRAIRAGMCNVWMWIKESANHNHYVSYRVARTFQPNIKHMCMVYAVCRCRGMNRKSVRRWWNKFVFCRVHRKYIRVHGRTYIRVHCTLEQMKIIISKRRWRCRRWRKRDRPEQGMARERNEDVAAWRACVRACVC